MKKHPDRDKHKFKYEGGGKTVVFKSDDLVYLPDILAMFEDYLRGAGFVFNGHLEIVEGEFEGEHEEEEVESAPVSEMRTFSIDAEDGEVLEHAP